MSTGAYSSFGCVLQYGDGSTPEAYANIAEITNLEPPELSVGKEEATNMDSPGGWKEWILTLFEAGDVAIDYNWKPANAAQAQAVADFAAKTARSWRIAFSDWGHVTKVATVNTTNEVWTSTAHTFETGQPVRITTSGTLPTSTPQVDLVSIYWVRRIDADTFTLHPTNADAVANTNTINFTAAGSGDHTMNAGTVWDFEAQVLNLKPAAATPAGKLAHRATLAISGVPTLT